MTKTSFENFEEQWKQAELLDNKLLPLLYEKAKELGVTIVQIHDSLILSGSIGKPEELYNWMKAKTAELLSKQ